MVGRDSGKPAVAGGSAHHVPVLGRQVIEFLAVLDGGIYVDGTFGAGGYSRLLLAAGARVIGIDRDQTAGRRNRRPAHSGSAAFLATR
jgi:16S rRNA (cytosine1402-N4)-methyltransferase